MINSKTMRNGTVLVCCALAAMLLNSCQKELTGTVDTFGCKVQQFTYLNANGGISSSFSYSYDSATSKATQLVYTDSLGLQTTVTPTFKGDTVFFSNGSYAVLDGSKRIKHLVERSAISAISSNGDYYYEYDASSHISKRTYDDGTNSYISNATFTGDALTKFTLPYGTVSDVVALAYTYSDSVKVSDYNYFVMVGDDFPELQLYLPCFTIGVFTTKAITKEDITVAIPLITLPTISTSFTNYALTGQGYISSVTVTTSIAGIPYPSGISASYICK